MRPARYAIRKNRAMHWIARAGRGNDTGNLASCCPGGPEDVSKPILILNGPNLNMLGKREPHIYGATTLAEVEEMCRRRASTRGLEIAFHQSNSESQIVDWIHEGIDGAGGIIINAAAFTHTSVAILDALKMVSQPIIELHISNPHRREPFRHHSYVTPAATAIICGLGVNGYPLAVDAMADLLETRAAQNIAP
jgi:3-dehydroquinate dehydratase-2